MPARTDTQVRDDELEAEQQAIENEELDALENAEPLSEDIHPNGDQAEGDLPGEDDDNPYGESDEALPDDREEAAMTAGLRELEE